MTWSDLAEEQAQYALAWTLRAPAETSPRMRRAMLGDAEDAVEQARSYREMHEAGAVLVPALGMMLSMSGGQ